MVWAFSTYAGVITTPWTIGWIILWLVYSPIATWSGVFLFARAGWFGLVCLAAVVAAVPFWPDARWMLLTIFASAIIGGSWPLWKWIGIFVAIVCGIWVWYHGGLGL